MIFDRDCIDYKNKTHVHTIYCEASNTDDIEYPNIKKGWFCYIIYSGNKIKDWPDIQFLYDSNKSSEFLLNVDTWPIVHKKVVECFNMLGVENIQYLPVKVTDKVTGEECYDYYVLNILNMIDAYDLRKSKYTYDKEIDSYQFLPPDIVLNYKKCKNYDIFRCEKDNIPIYVSQRIKEAIEKENFIGFKFIKQRVHKGFFKI